MALQRARHSIIGEVCEGMKLRKDSRVSVSRYGWRILRLRHALLGLFLTGRGWCPKVGGQSPQADAPRARIALPQVDVPRQCTLETVEQRFVPNNWAVMTARYGVDNARSFACSYSQAGGPYASS